MPICLNKTLTGTPEMVPCLLPGHLFVYKTNSPNLFPAAEYLGILLKKEDPKRQKHPRSLSIQSSLELRNRWPTSVSLSYTGLTQHRDRAESTVPLSGCHMSADRGRIRVKRVPMTGDHESTQEALPSVQHQKWKVSISSPSSRTMKAKFKCSLTESEYCPLVQTLKSGSSWTSRSR